VVPNAPGGAADITARTIGQVISTALGHPVVIDNKPGAGGVGAGEQVARADADGHTCCWCPAAPPSARRCSSRCPSTR
jgi:tripartite-type tricarboxylate transporter receptor subunit TctC